MRSPDGSSLRAVYPVGMAKRSKKPADLNRLAAAIVGDATDETDTPKEASKHPGRQRAGEAGGKARAAALDAEQRRAIAKKAARSRWTSRQAD